MESATMSFLDEFRLQVGSSPPRPRPRTLSPPPAEFVRRSSRLEERRRSSLGPFRDLPCEIVQLIMSYLSVRSLAQLAQVSSGWQLFLHDWIDLRSTAWILAPGRRHPVQSDTYYEEYTELGLLCRRVFTGPTMQDRAHDFWRIIERVERTSQVRVGPQYEPTFLGVSNFIRAALPLNCCQSQGERFETMWLVIQDVIGVDRQLLQGLPGGSPVEETDLRLALRVLFLSPTVPPRNANFLVSYRVALLKTLLSKLNGSEQARLLFICYGPRTGGPIEWTKPCDPAFHTLSQMAHAVGELGTAINALSRGAPPTFIYNLVQHLIKTPNPWLPRFEMMLLLTMGERAAGAVLAGYANKIAYQNIEYHSINYVITRMARMASLSQLFLKKILAGEARSGAALTAATVSIQDVLRYYYEFVPGPKLPHLLIDNVITQAFFLSFTVGGSDFAGRVLESLNPVALYLRSLASSRS